MPAGLFLLLTCPTGHCTGQLPGLPLSYCVDTSQRLKDYWDEFDSYSLAFFIGPPDLSVVGVCEGMTWGGGSCCHCLALQWVDDCDVEGSIPSLGPVGDQNICRSSVGTWEEVLSLFDRAQNSSCSHAVDVVTEMVMPGDPFSPGPTAHCTGHGRQRHHMAAGRQGRVPLAGRFCSPAAASLPWRTW